MTQPIRVLVGKVGLDGHDRGALVIAQGLRDQGMEVIYSGLRQTPEQIVSTAIQEDVACIGLSSLSGAHMDLFLRVMQLLREQHVDDILVVGGGVIPDEDIPTLLAGGIAAVFTPGTTIETVASFIRDHNKRSSLDMLPVHDVPKHVDHIGIAVESIAQALPFYTGVLGLSVSHEEIVADQRVRTVFLQLGEVDIELLEPTDASSPIAKYLEKRGPGIHHIAYAVDDVAAWLESAKSAGIRVLDEAPRPGGQGKLIAFLHPKDTGGVLTEYCQRTVEEDETK